LSQGRIRRSLISRFSTFHDVNHLTVFMTNIMYSVKWLRNKG